MHKKIYIYTIILIVLCASCFFAGGIGPGRKAESLGLRVIESERRAEESDLRQKETANRLEERNRQLIEANRSHSRNLAELRGSSEDITRELTGIYDSIGDSQQGIQEADSRIVGVQEGIRYYIEKAEAQESGDNR